MHSWKKVKLGEILSESKVESIENNVDKRIRVLLNAKGVVKRPITSEAEGATKYFTRKAGQFIYGKQNLHKGAFGIIPQELDSFESSSDLPAFDVDESCVPEWLDFFLKQGDYYLELVSIAKGAATKRIQPKEFFKVEIPLPDKETQLRLIHKFIDKTQANDELIAEIANQKKLLSQLKQAILQEAIQGKLTADWRVQNPDVEPASELLKRIKAEKEKLVKEKKIRRGKKQTSNELDNHNFKLPDTWFYSDLDDISIYVTDGTHQTPTYTESGRMFLSAQNVKPFKFMPEKHRYVSEAAYENYISNRKAEKGDLLLGRVGAGIGETAVVDQDLDFAIYVSLGLVKTFKEYTNSNYLAVVFNSPYGVRYAKGNVSSEGGSAGNFNLGRIRSFPIPFPPLEEQKAIVQKVEALMDKCRVLEAEIAQSEAHAQMLMQAVLKEAFEPAAVEVEQEIEQPVVS